MWFAISRSLRPTLLPTFHRGLAAKAGKPSSAAPAQAKVEASTSTEPDSKPAVDYPDWLGRLTKPGRTLGELRRTPEDERTMTDNVRFEKLSNRAAIKSRNFSKAKGV